MQVTSFSCHRLRRGPYAFKHRMNVLFPITHLCYWCLLFTGMIMIVFPCMQLLAEGDPSLHWADTSVPPEELGICECAEPISRGYRHKRSDCIPTYVSWAWGQCGVLLWFCNVGYLCILGCYRDITEPGTHGSVSKYFASLGYRGSYARFISLPWLRPCQDMQVLQCHGLHIRRFISLLLTLSDDKLQQLLKERSCMLRMMKRKWSMTKSCVPFQEFRLSKIMMTFKLIMILFVHFHIYHDVRCYHSWLSCRIL